MFYDFDRHKFHKKLNNKNQANRNVPRGVIMNSSVKWTLMSGACNRFFIACLKIPPPVSDREWKNIIPPLCGRNVKDILFFHSSSDKKVNRLFYEWEGGGSIKGRESSRRSRSLAHGVVILYPSSSEEADLKWLFFNSDGSVAEMCGNAACCVVEYAVKQKLISPHKTSFVIQTPYQFFKGECKDGQARVVLKQNFALTGPFSLDFSPEEQKGEDKTFVSYHFVNTGVPHAVIKKKKLLFNRGLTPLRGLGRVLRGRTLHHHRGMNVSFYCETDKKRVLRAVTYERGVEGLTPACGTGALAVVRSHVQNHPEMWGQPVYVDMPGGRLSVCFQEGEVWLSSPVQWIGWLEEKNLFPRSSGG